MPDETTDQQQTELTESQLADMAATLDATGEVAVEEATPTPEATPAPDAEPKPEGDATKKDAEPTKIEPKTEDKGPGTEAADKQPNESEYTKAKKELERRDRSWQKLEEEKAALRKEREELESSRKQITQAAQVRDDAGYTSDDYDKAAKDFDAAGDAALAAKARAKAQGLRESAQTTQVEAQRQKFANDWQATVNKVIEEKPDLKDANSPFGQKVAAALKANPHFSYIPDGFRRVVEHVELQDKAASVPGLQSEVETLKKEIERLNKLTSVGGSGPTSRPGAKSIDDMTAKEAEAELSRLAEEADRQAA